MEITEEFKNKLVDDYKKKIEHNKIYLRSLRKRNPDKIKEYQKTYYNKISKPKILNDKTHICDKCDGYYSYFNYNKHCRTKKHQKALELN